ncbi:hypothetical protein [Streptomyces sp. MZ04]|uniref:hypothetical protein n=1 Tax=Streptomyces sp. MZ04 TaxID=2559236 RepID=UPI00107E9567|nr:hypothetical protein [Streptomyces sp. MZ04]TGB03140.1 hypothetical protein E2651_26055 [Streptomyces sp. MZ04]
MKRRTTVLAAAVLGALSAAGPAAAVEVGPLVRTGDIDLFEDVLEHISVPMGDGGRMVHQLYDSRGAGGTD